MTPEPDYDAEMRLAEGVTCDDCAHAKRCFAFGYSTPGRTSCDFWPSRFRAPLADNVITDPTRATAERQPEPRDTDKKAALETARKRVEEINAREAERLRLAGVKRTRQGKQQAKGMAT